MNSNRPEVERLRRRLRALAQAVIEIRRCCRDSNGPCSAYSFDGHLRDAYGLADDAIGYLGKPDVRPS